MIRYVIVLVIAVTVLTACVNSAAASETKNSLPSEETGFNENYSEKLALGLSLGSTLGFIGIGGVLAGIGMGANAPGAIGTGCIIGILGLLAGPSVGHSYLQNSRQGLFTFLGRSTLFLVGGGLLIGLVSRNVIGEIDDKTDIALFTFMWVAAAGILALDIYDFVTIPRAARKANENAKGRRISAMIAPAIVPSNHGRSVIGLGVAGSF